MQILSIELSYQRILTILKSPYSYGLKLTALTKFINSLLSFPEQDKLISYYTELAPELYAMIRHADLSCFAPEDIENIISISNQLNSNRFTPVSPGELFDIQIVLTNALENQNKNLKSYENDTNKTLSPNNVAIVLIEKCDEESADGVKNIGHVHRLNISSSFRDKSETTDKIEFKNYVDINDTKILEHLNKVVNIVKNKYAGKHSYYNITFYFDKSNFLYSGTSLGIGAICLTYNSILISNLERYYYKFRSDCVFSGEIDYEGCLQKLNSESLKIKLRTVYYSEYRRFILPEDNLSEAKSELERLKKKYPERKLILIPIRNFESVFTNLEIVDRYELKINQKLKAYYKKFHTPVVSVLGVISLGVLLFFTVNYLIPLLDRNPYSSDFLHGKYTVYNEHNTKIWERQIDNYDAKHILNDKVDFLRRSISIQDLDKDNENEIIILNNYYPAPDIIGKNTLFCYKADNTLMWKYENEYEKLNYWDKPEGEFVFDDLLTYDINSDGIYETIASGHINPWYPNKICILDLNGKLISKYWHAGNLHRFKVYDLDKDSNPEIVATGVTNMKGYRCGCLIAFDPEYISGVSFNTDSLQNIEKGLEKYYVLFPVTFMTKFSPSGMNDANDLHYEKNGFAVAVTDGPQYEMPNDRPLLLYKFSKDFKIESIGLSSQFQKEYDKLILYLPLKRLNFTCFSNKTLLLFTSQDFVPYYNYIGT